MAGRKVALLTDSHFGVRKGSQIFHDYFERFYSETFFPVLEERDIRTVIHLGDVFDVRKGIDYWSLDWAKRVFFDPCQERNIDLRMLIGNHDIFYKNNLSLNSSMNLDKYDNITVYDSPRTDYVECEQIYFVPWVCEDNVQPFMRELLDTKAKLCVGHLELAGFYANKDYLSQHGMDPNIFKKFDLVMSGHYHKKSTSGNVTYLGNPYQLYWNDEGETRGFHILDLDTQELEFIPNPNNMFHKIYLNSKTKVDPEQFKDTYIKVIVEESHPKKLNNLVDSLYQVGIHDLKVIETMDLTIDDDVDIEAEDTLTTLTNYVSEMDETINKDSVTNIFKSLYVEAQEV